MLEKNVKFNASDYKLWILSLAYFVSGTGSLAVVGLLNPMAESLNVSKTAIAELMTVFALTFAFAAPGIQVLLGRLPRKRLLVLGLSMLALGSIGSALSPNYSCLFFFRIIMGMGAAATGPVCSAIAANMVAPARQGRALATVFGGLSISTVLGIPLAAWIGSVMDWRWFFVLLGGLVLLVIAGVCRWIEDASSQMGMRFSSFVNVFKNTAGSSALLISVLFMAGQFVSYTFLAQLLQERFAINPQTTSIALLLFGLGGVIGNIYAGKLSDKMGANSTIIISIASLAVVMGAYYLSSSRWSISLMVFSSWAVINMMFQAPQQKRLITLAPQTRNLILAMNASAFYLGISLGSFISGQVYAMQGVSVLPVISLFIFVLALLVQFISQFFETKLRNDFVLVRPIK